MGAGGAPGPENNGPAGTEYTLQGGLYLILIIL